MAERTRKWGNLAESKRRGRSALEAEETAVMVGKFCNRTQNGQDVVWLQSILAMAGLSSRHKQKIETSIAWLKEVSTRTLGQQGTRTGWRQFYSWLEMTLKSGGYKSDDHLREMPPGGEVHRRSRLRSMRNEETKAKLPDWMFDASKLPKRPPGGA